MISRSHLSKVLRQKGGFAFAGWRHHLLFADESEALTHPYLARASGMRGADLRVPAPGQTQKVAMIGSLDYAKRKLAARPARPSAGD
jgi:hypothetical protein